MEKAIVILSGGMDSTTLLYDVIDQGFDVHAITFDYGQRHAKEIWCAMYHCNKLHIPHKIVNLNALHDIAPSSLTRDNIDVPEGRYDEPSMKLTVVPNRNMVLISLAVTYAIGIKAQHVFYGAHAGDHAIYPDCRWDFIKAMKDAVSVCDWSEVKLHAPYVDLDKGDIAIIGKRLDVDYSLTWSCYVGKEEPCGKCGACTERTEALEKAGLVKK